MRRRPDKAKAFAIRAIMALQELLIDPIGIKPGATKAVKATTRKEATKLLLIAHHNLGIQEESLGNPMGALEVYKKGRKYIDKTPEAFSTLAKKFDDSIQRLQHVPYFASMRRLIATLCSCRNCRMTK
jgi:hypothetical protein